MKNENDTWYVKLTKEDRAKVMKIISEWVDVIGMDALELTFKDVIQMSLELAMFADARDVSVLNQKITEQSNAKET